MGTSTRFPAFALSILLAVVSQPSLSAQPALEWKDWHAGIIAQAKEQGRFIILDLEAVWCHWCHVMEATTYQDPKVVDLLKSKFLTIRVDQDANPDLSSRYGDWGWPATIIFAPDGTELVKRRGYIPPADMSALLAAVIADPTPGPSVDEIIDVRPADSHVLSAPQRAELLTRSRESFDEVEGGWGDGQKFIDADAMDLLLAQSQHGDKEAAKRARQTLDAALSLIDPVSGGIYQYSDTPDWTSPHYEKIMWYQANGLRQYAQAYALWKDPRHLAAARSIYTYLSTKLIAPEGGIYTSQDADVDEKIPGKDFYALDASGRRALGREPRIDKAIYSRENGWAISGFIAYYSVTGDPAALATAEKSAEYIVANRSHSEGKFSHGPDDRGGPYLSDTLAMGQAALDLYAATSKRQWLKLAANAGTLLNLKFKDHAGGLRTTLQAESNGGVFLKPAKPIDEQIQAVRFANRLNRYTGSADFKDLAEHGAKYLAAPEILDLPRPLPGILLVDDELRTDPVHITIVGHKSDASAVAMHSAALGLAGSYKRLDWWDTDEGPLENPDVTYPSLDQAAAFICTNRICSLPMFTAGEMLETLQRLTATRPDSKG